MEIKVLLYSIICESLTIFFDMQTNSEQKQNDNQYRKIPDVEYLKANTLNSELYK